MTPQVRTKYNEVLTCLKKGKSHWRYNHKGLLDHPQDQAEINKHALSETKQLTIKYVMVLNKIFIPGGTDPQAGMRGN